ncbi:MAG TPA: hypothetical protein VGE99_05325 [Candidatus Dormibacteraeota bacterium]
MQSWRNDRALGARLVIAIVLVGYLVAIWLSHLILLPHFLQAPLVLTGWLFLPGLFVVMKVRRLDMSRSAQPPVKELFRPWAMTAGFGVIAAATLVLAIVWDVPTFCHGPVPVNCMKGYQWSVDAGHYYHSFQEGTRTEISQQRYFQEVDFDLRSAAAFGVCALCLAWIGAAGLRASPRAPSADSRS